MKTCNRPAIVDGKNISFVNSALSKKVLLSFLLGLIVSHSNAQDPSPGGVSAGLRLWVKANQGVITSGSNVTSWNDQSLGARHLAPSTAIYQPQLEAASATYNFNSYINFNSDFVRYTGNVLPLNSGASVFSVAHQSGGTGYSTLWDFYSNDPTINTQGGRWLFWHSGAAYHSTNLTQNKPTLASSHWQHNMSASSFLELNGKSEAVLQAVNTNGNNYYLGAGSSGAAEPWIGGIAENIVYDAPLSGTDLEQVNSYLAIKYGLTLDNDPSSLGSNYNYRSSSSGIIWDGSGNATYHHDITGIGRDDNSGLSQLKSKSINQGSVVTIETSSFSTDESFLVIGDNAGNAALSVPYTTNSVVPVPTVSFFRYGRIWKAQITGSVGPVTISVNSSSATYLLVHNGADFSTGTPTEILLTGGAASVTLTDGQYFTFAGPATAPGGVIADLNLWLKADIGTNTITHAAAISEWLDYSGNNRTHTQLTGAQQPQFIRNDGNALMNYQPAVRFDGTNDNLTTPIFKTALENKAIYVFSVSRSTRNNQVWETLYSFEGDLFHVDWYNDVPGMYLVGNRNFPTTKGYNWGINSFIVPNNASASTRVYWNGTNSGNLTAGLVNAYLDGNSGNYCVGMDINNTDHLQGDIQEVIIYTGTAGQEIDASVLRRVQSYLALKYGISLDPAGQPNYAASDGTTLTWTGANNTGYQNNIFGLGRDDNSSLYQKQAFSYGDSTITIYLGTLATLNSENSSVINADKSFLILGDNNGTGYNNTLNTPAGEPFANGNALQKINQLSNRVLKAQATNQSSWLINIRNNKVPMAHSVLVSSSSSFTPASTRIYPLTSGVAQNVLVNDGDYLSFASFAIAPGGVTTDLGFWVKSNNATAGYSWPDNSVNNNPIEVVGNPSLAAANAQHNFYPYYTGFSTSNYFRDIDPSLTIDNTYGTQTRTSFSMFSAVRSTAAQGTGSGRILGIDNDDMFAAEPGFSLNAANPYFYKFLDGTGSNTSTQDVTANKSSVLSYVANQTLNSGNGALAIALDGRTETFNRSAGNYFHILGKYLLLGYGTWDLSSAFPGDIMEVAWYKRALSADEESRVSSYLALKNGTTLGSTSSTYNYLNTLSQVVWTGDAAFQNNVAGIGRDDNEALNQKQSNSVNPHSTGQITMSLGRPGASIATNANTFIDDMVYLVWGDNGITTTATGLVSDYGAGVSINHLQRVWKVVNTDLNQPVNVVFPASLLPGALGSACEGYKMITSNAATISGASITSVNSLAEESGNYIVELNFPVGTTYFTLARVDPVSSGLVYLPTINTYADNFSNCTTIEWNYFYEDVSREKKLFALSGFTPAEISNFSVNITTSGVSYVSPTNETTVMPRIATVTDASSGSYSGGKVRVYFSESELENTKIPGAPTNNWIKYSGNAAALFADILDNGVFVPGNAMALTPAVTGVEDGVSFVEFHNITSFSSFIFISYTSSLNAILPVRIGDFNASRAGETIRLDWTTATEQNNTGFDIERSVDNNSWNKIGFVASSAPGGNSNNKLVYNFIDQAPADGVNKYRLKQVDQDGRIKYSSVVSVRVDQPGKVKLSPNPLIKGVTTVRGLQAGDKVQVISQTGQILFSKTASGQQMELSLLHRPIGVYHLVVMSKGKRISLKILKAD